MTITECDSLADGTHRRLRESGKPCKCKDGWGGINCNGEYYRECVLTAISWVRAVCKSDNACKGFPLAGAISSLTEGNANMTCYTGGETVFNNHQMCNVTSASSLATARLAPSLLNTHALLQIARFWTCFQVDPLRSRLAVKAQTILALSSFGPLRPNRSTAPWTSATRCGSQDTTRIPQSTLVTISSANAYPGVLFAERMEV
jgi:hypothetical protein